MRTSKKNLQVFRLKLAVLAIAACFSPLALANPVGPTVVSGAATFANNGNSLVVTNTPGAIVNWQQFNIGAGQTTQFVQQSAQSSVLNRVIGGNPSQILGTLQSNGQVYLVNPGGIVFGAGSVVDVGGLIASTMNITNADFLMNRMNFSGNNGASVINQGTITTPFGGSVYLIGNNVTNQGVITAPNGDVVLAAGNSVSMVNSVTPHVSVTVSAPTGQAVNLGQVTAQGGSINIYAAMIKQQGLISANSASVNAQGQVVLSAAQSVDLSAGSVTSAANSSGTGGTVQVLGNQVNIAGTVDASGAAGGGTILAGGDMRGQNPSIVNAQNTVVTGTLNADATQNGNGGKVIVWADNSTRVDGQVSAQGGMLGGNGGFVETSGKQTLSVSTAAKIGAPKGQGGTWLLDPQALMVVGAAAMPPPGYVLGGTASPFTAGVSPSYITDAVLLTALQGGGNVILDTGAGPCAVVGTCNITIQGTATALTGFAPGAATTLTMNAADSINILAPITSAGAAFNMVLNHGVGSGTGGATITGAGAFNLAGGTLSVNNNNALGMGTINFINAGASTVGTFDAASLSIAGTSFTTTNTAAPQILISAVTLQDATSIFNNAVPIDISTLNFVSGTITGAGAITIPAGGFVNVGAAVPLTNTALSYNATFSGSTLSNSGTMTIGAAAPALSAGTSTLTIGGVSVLNNLAGATLNLNNGAMSGGAGGTFNNAGTMNVNSYNASAVGSNSMSVGTYSNSGVWNINNPFFLSGSGSTSGTVNIAAAPAGTPMLGGITGGSHTLTGNASIAGAGTLNVSGFSNLLAMGVNSVSNLVVSSGNLNGSGTLTVNNLDISGGVLSFPGTLNVTNSYIDNGTAGVQNAGNINITQAIGNLTIGRGISATGTATFKSTTGSVAINAPINSQLAPGAGTVNLQVGTTISQGAGGFINAASLTTTAAGGTNLNLANTVNSFSASDTGAINFWNTAPGISVMPGTLTLGAINAPGGINVTNTGNLTVGGPVSIGSANLVTNSTLHALGAGAMLTNAGTITMATTPNCTLITCNGNWLNLSAERMTLAGGSILGAGGNFVNIGTGTQAVNLGSTVKTTANTLELSNADLASITASHLNIGGGSITVSAPITFSQTGWVDLWASGAGGTGTIINNSSIAAPNVPNINIANNNVNLNGGLSLGADKMMLAGGTISAPAVGLYSNAMTVSGAVNLGSTTDNALNTLELSNAELATINAANLYIQGNNIVVSAPINFLQTGSVGLEAWSNGLAGAGMITNNSSIAANSAINGLGLMADKMALAGGTISAPSVFLSGIQWGMGLMAPVQAAVDLGSATDLAIGTLELSNAELATITAANLHIGGPTVTVSAPVAYAQTLSLGGDTVSDVGGLSGITAPMLNISSLLGTSFTGTGNHVGSLMASNLTRGNILFTNSFAPFTIRGLSNPVGNIAIDNIGGIVVNGPASSSGTFSMWAHSPITVNAGASITSGGAMTLTAGSVGSLLPADVITINGTLSGASIALGGNSVVGNIPAGATLNVASQLTAAQQICAQNPLTCTQTTPAVTSTTTAPVAAVADVNRAVGVVVYSSGMKVNDGVVWITYDDVRHSRNDARRAEHEEKNARDQVKNAKTPEEKARAEKQLEVKVVEAENKKTDARVRETESEVRAAEDEVRTAKNPDDRLRAETRKSVAESKNAEAEVRKAEAEVKQAEVESKQAVDPAAKALLEARKVAAEVKKAEAEVKKAQVDEKKAISELKKAEAEAQASDAPQAKATVEVKKSEVEVKKAEAEVKKAEVAAKTAKDPQSKEKAEIKLAAAESAKAEAEAKQAAAEVKKEEVKVQESGSGADKSRVETKKAEAEVKKAEAEIKQAKLEEKTAKNPEVKAKVEEKIAKAEVAKAEAEEKAAEIKSGGDKNKHEVEAKKANVEAKKANLEAKGEKDEGHRASAEGRRALAEARRAEAEEKAAIEEVKIAREEAKQAASSESKYVAQKKIEAIEAKVEAKRIEVAAKKAEVELKHTEVAIKQLEAEVQSAPPEQKAVLEKRIAEKREEFNQKRVEVERKSGEVAKVSAEVKAKESDYKEVKVRRDDMAIAAFAGIDVKAMSKDNVQQALAARHEFMKETLAPALNILKANPAAADLKTCGSGGDGVCINPSRVQAAANQMVDVMPRVQLPTFTPTTSFLPQIQRKIAIVIGNNAYQDPNIPSLNGAVHDADGVAQMFQEKMGYEARVIHNGTRADIVNALNKVADETGSRDSVVVYYAGHGYQMEDTKVGYWIPTDATTSNPENWISNSDINKMLTNIPARQMILVSDSCYSGSLTNEQKIASTSVNQQNVEDILAKRSVTVMSSGGEEPVMDEGREGHSAFAWHLMDKLSHVESYKNGAEVFNAVKEGVASDGLTQIPQYGASVTAGHTQGGDYLYEVRKY